MNRVRLLGVHVDTVDKAELLATFQHVVREGGKIVVGHHNLHSVYIYHRDPVMRKFYEAAGKVYVDGMPLVFWGALLGLPLRRRNRITLSEWMPSLLAHAAEQRWRVYYLGSTAAVARRGVELFRQCYPTLQMQAHHGFFDVRRDSLGNRAVIAEIQAFRPQILMVGMGMPRQEAWILENYRILDSNVVMSVGAAIQYFADTTLRPPPWLGNLGLEWIFRLTCEPSRLWKRYLIEPFHLLKLLPRDFIAYRLSRRNPK